MLAAAGTNGSNPVVLRCPMLSGCKRVDLAVKTLQTQPVTGRSVRFLQLLLVGVQSADNISNMQDLCIFVLHLQVWVVIDL